MNTAPNDFPRLRMSDLHLCNGVLGYHDFAAAINKAERIAKRFKWTIGTTRITFASSV
jgi:hypothetical protein